MNIKNELQRIYDDIMAQRDISWGDCIFLQEHQDDIKKLYPDDPLLWEWSGIPETEWLGGKLTKREKQLVYHAALLATLAKAAQPNKTNAEIIDSVVEYINRIGE